MLAEPINRSLVEEMKYTSAGATVDKIVHKVGMFVGGSAHTLAMWRRRKKLGSIAIDSICPILGSDRII